MSLSFVRVIYIAYWHWASISKNLVRDCKGFYSKEIARYRG